MLVFLLNCISYGTWFSTNLHRELQRYDQHLPRTALDSWAGKRQLYLCFN